MLYEALKRTIARGETEGLREKIDVFYSAGRLTGEEHSELAQLLEI